MTAREAAVAAAQEARLYRESVRLTRDFLARVREGDDSGGVEFNRRQGELFARIEAMSRALEPFGRDAEPVAAHSRESARAVVEIMELNRDLIARLEARKTRVRQDIEDIRRRRQSLASYRGPDEPAPALIDHVG